MSVTMTATVIPDYYLIEDAEGFVEADEAFELLDDHDAYEGYYLCAVIKYGVRAGLKTEDPTEDLAKLRDCVCRAVRHREKRRAGE